MSDLLNTLNQQLKKSAEGATSVAPASTPSSTLVGAEASKVEDLTSAARAIKNDSETAKSSSSSADKASASSKNESSGSDTNIVDDPETWSKESAFKEVKKLREENKTYRLKYQEQIESLRREAEERILAKEEEMKNLQKAQEELSKIKAEQEDKKRSLEEKLAHRDSKVNELQQIMEAKEKEYQRRMSELENLANQYKAKEEVEKQIYVSRIQEEVDKIPEKFKEIASMIVKGAGEDPRDGLLALNEAKLKGLFEDKTVIVNHSVPGAKDGARASKDRLEEAAREQRAKMSSKELIRAALNELKSGGTNSAFRQK
jgi:chromosome segregation ATPase